MRELLTGDDLFAEVLLLGDQKKAVVLVEGPDDVDALEGHIHDTEAFLIPGYGKTSVEYAVQLVDAQGIRFALALLDRDFVGTLDPPLSSTNVVYTDMYDLDATIILTSDACVRVASSFCDNTRMRRHLARTGVPFADFWIKPSLAIGVLRLLAREAGIPVSVREFPVAEVMDMNGGLPDLEKLIIIAHSKYGGEPIGIDSKALQATLQRRISEAGSELLYCSGHDLAAAFAGIMRRKWGCVVKADVVVKAIRAAFARENLKNTKLFGLIAQWASARGVQVWSCP